MISATANAASVSIVVGNEGGPAGSTVGVPVTASEANGLGGLDFILAYDPAVLSAVNVSAGSLNKGIIEANASVPGILAVSMADPNGMNGMGDVAIINFNVIGASNQTCDLVLSNVQAFDATTLGEMPVTVANGTFTVSPAAPASSASPAASGGEAPAIAFIALGLGAGISMIRGRFR